MRLCNSSKGLDSSDPCPLRPSHLHRSEVDDSDPTPSQIVLSLGLGPRTIVNFHLKRSLCSRGPHPKYQ